MKTTTKLSSGLLIVTVATLVALNASARRNPTPTPTPTATPAAIQTFSVRDLSGSCSFRLVPAVSFAPWYDGDAAGEPDSGVNSAPRQDILRVGVITFDGNGNVIGHMLATTDNGLTTAALDFNFIGTYTVNSDGTGTLSIAPSTGTFSVPGEGNVEGAETYSIVINPGKDRSFTIDLAETDNVGGGAKIFLTGQAVNRGKINHDSGDND